MDHSTAYIIAQYLISQGEGVTPGDSGDWPIYTSVLPDGEKDKVPDDAIGSFVTTPIKDGRYMQTGESIYHEGVQLLVRTGAYKHNEGFAKAKDLLAALDAVKQVSITIGSSDYLLHTVTATTGVVGLGQDEGTKRRELFSLNFLVSLEET